MSYNWYSVSLLVIYATYSFTNVQSQSTYLNQPRQPVYLNSRPQSWPQLQYQPQPQLPSQARSHRQPIQQSPKPQGPNSYAPQYPVPPAGRSVSYTHKITTLPDNRNVYHHSLNSDGHNYHETRYIARAQAPVQSIVSRAVSQNPLNSVQYPHQKFNARYIENQQNRRRVTSNELSSPVILNQPAVPSSWLNDNVKELFKYIKSSKFLNNDDTLATPQRFLEQIINDEYQKADLEIIAANKLRTNLTFESNDCKPKMTTIKIGRIEEPEIIYNPPSIEVARCPQACFSWQFDCIPVKRVSYNFTVAVYKIDADSNKILRNVDVFEIDFDEKCVCSCQSLAGCFGNTKFGSQRLPSSR